MWFGEWVVNIQAERSSNLYTVGVEKSQVENKICGPDIVSNVEVSREM